MFLEWERGTRSERTENPETPADGVILIPS